MRITYTIEQKRKAVQTYKKLGSFTKTIRKLGYPSNHVLCEWVRNGIEVRKPRKPNAPSKRYDWRLKHEAVSRVLSGENIKDVAEALKVTNCATIYEWVRYFRERGTIALMSKKEQIEAGIYKTRAQLKKSLPDDPEELKDIAARLLAEKAVLEQELELAKKSPGGIPEKLPPRQKSLIAMKLRKRLPLELLFEVLDLKPSSFYYASSIAERPDKYAFVRKEIEDISCKSGRTYGSPRIWASLRRRGVFVSEKVVRRLMREDRIEVRYAKRKRRYTSYIGEVTPAPDDLVKRNFHADEPNQLWLTDITEFSASDDKVYLSPVVDCFDGKVVAWRTSRHPDIDLVETMMDDAIASLDDETAARIKDPDDPRSLIVHNDRGGHYRGGMWIEKLEGQGITRSMSRKGRSGDNAACEGFFGRMKTEMYYGIKWERASDLERSINEYMDFYNNRRIKMSLGGLTIKEHRDRLAKVSK